MSVLTWTTTKIATNFGWAQSTGTQHWSIAQTNTSGSELHAGRPTCSFTRTSLLDLGLIGYSRQESLEYHWTLCYNEGGVRINCDINRATQHAPIFLSFIVSEKSLLLPQLAYEYDCNGSERTNETGHERIIRFQFNCYFQRDREA